MRRLMSGWRNPQLSGGEICMICKKKGKATDGIVLMAETTERERESD